MAMKLSVGKIAFPIEFDNGDKDVIYFNPNDPDLATRLMTAKDKISERINGIESDDFDIKNDGSVDTSEDNENETPIKTEQFSRLIEATKEIMFSELDSAFDSDISKTVFKHCSPFAIVNGEYFIVQFLNAITPEIEKHIKRANAELEKKMNKHIGKYSK